MTVSEFVRNNKVRFTYSTIKENEIPTYEKSMGVKMGEQLKEYIVEYGFLAFCYVEMFGINDIRQMKSDMIMETEFVHDMSDKAKNLIALEDQGDGDYFLVDSEDNVYRFIPALDELTPMNVKLYDHILARFMSVDEGE